MTQEQIARRMAQAGDLPMPQRGSSASCARSRRCGARPRAARGRLDRATPGGIPGEGRVLMRLASRKSLFDAKPIACVQNRRLAFLASCALRPALFVAIAVDPDKTTPNVRRVAGDLVKGQYGHFDSPFRLAGMAGMGGSYRQRLPNVNTATARADERYVRSNCVSVHAAANLIARRDSNPLTRPGQVPNTRRETPAPGRCARGLRCDASGGNRARGVRSRQPAAAHAERDRLAVGRKRKTRRWAGSWRGTICACETRRKRVMPRALPSPC